MKILNVNDLDDTLQSLQNIIIDRNNSNKEKNRRRFARESLTIINIIDFAANANRIIRQLIQNTNQLSAKINEFQAIHNKVIVFINDLKEFIITKKNLNIQFD